MKKAFFVAMSLMFCGVAFAAPFSVGKIPKALSGRILDDSQIYDNGTNVGVGTTVPIAKMDVEGTIYSSTTITASGGFIGNITGNVTGNVTGALTGNITGNAAGSAASLSGASTLPNGTLATTQSASDNTTKVATTAFVITEVANKTTFTNNVGIGSASPTAKLDVRGEIKTPKINNLVIIDGVLYPRSCAGITTALTGLSDGDGLKLTKGAADYSCAATVTIDKGIYLFSDENVTIKAETNLNSNILLPYHEGITIRNITIDGNKANQGTPPANEYSNVCINAYQAPNLVLDGVTLKDCQNHAVRLSYSPNATINNLNCVDPGKVGLAGNIYGNCLNVGESPNLLFTNSKSSGSLGSGVFFYSAGDGIKNSGKILNFDCSGVQTDQTSCVETNNAGASVADEITIDQLYAHNVPLLSHGVNGALLFGDNMTVVNSRIDVTGVGIEISSGSQNPLVANNRVKHTLGGGSDSVGIYISSDHGQYVDNIISNFAGNAFYFASGSEYNTVAYNTVLDPVQDSSFMVFDGTITSPRVIGNTVLDTRVTSKLVLGYNLIAGANITDLEIVDNKFTNVTASAYDGGATLTYAAMTVDSGIYITGDVSITDTVTGSNTGTDICIGSDKKLCVCGSCL